MDLFHAITQGIDQVLTCHYFDSFRDFKMSDSLMDTEAGGETPQYESIKTVTEPSAKQSGQMGDGHNTSENGDAVSAERGEKTAENVRYGQAISESGFGGKTTTAEGTSNQGGYGRTEAQEGEGKPEDTRREQGYGSGKDMRRDVGA